MLKTKFTVKNNKTNSSSKRNKRKLKTLLKFLKYAIKLAHLIATYYIS